MSLPSIRQIAEGSPLAARPHTCSVCGEPIAIGERYTRILYLDQDTLDRKHALRVAKIHSGPCPEKKELRDEHDRTS